MNRTSLSGSTAIKKGHRGNRNKVRRASGSRTSRNHSIRAASVNLDRLGEVA
jgi:hypothetical protein